MTEAERTELFTAYESVARLLKRCEDSAVRVRALNHLSASLEYAKEAVVDRIPGNEP